MEENLNKVLTDLKWFKYPNNKNVVKKVINGNFAITSGSIDLPEDVLTDGQYFRIVGSVFNDGLWKYPAEGMTDEQFTGSVWAMAVPPAVVALAEKIETYCASGAANPSPYKSESFPDGYSYSKGESAEGSTSNSWQTAFADELRLWRKL